MEISRTTSANTRPATRGSGMHTTQRPRREAQPVLGVDTVTPRAPTMIDIAAARSLAWMMNHLLRTISVDLEFVVQSESGDIVVRVLDKVTGDLIRHIPAEELPEVASILAETHGGLIEEMA